MSKYQVDFDKLETKLLKKAYRLEDVKDRLETVAFDIVKFKDGDQGANLWQIQSSDDGDYIVTLYEEVPEQTKTAAARSWAVRVSVASSTINVFYKGDPIVRVAASRIGIPTSELPLVESYLPKKLAENKVLVRALLAELSETAKNEVLSRYPELV